MIKYRRFAQKVEVKNDKTQMIYSKIQIENYQIIHNLRKNNLLENLKWQDKNNQKE